MLAGWQDTTVDGIKADVPNAVVGGPFGSDLTRRDYTPYGVPVVRGSNMTGFGRYIGGEFAFVSKEKAERHKGNLAQPGDLVFTQRGTLGQVALVPGDLGYDRFLVSQSQMKLAVDPGKADPLYVFYWFRLPSTLDYIARNAIQTGVPHINLAILKLIPISTPPLPEQKAIGRILGALDDKIELNRRMNETLEQTARAIFRSWFVDFDPVRAKAEGRAPAGLDPATAALFPDSLEDSALGEIPAGWEWRRLGEIVELYDHRRVPLSGRERAKRPGPYRYYGAAGVVDHIDDYLFDGTYVLVGEDGSVMDDAGHPVVQYVWGRFWVNNHAHVMKAKDGFSDEHLLLLLREAYILPYVTGAVQPKLNQGNLKSVKVVSPPEELRAQFGSIVAPLFARVRSNVDESRTLAAIRDALLPKLLSGELKVKDAEKVVERGA